MPKEPELSPLALLAVRKCRDEGLYNSSFADLENQDLCDHLIGSLRNGLGIDMIIKPNYIKGHKYASL